MLFRHDASISWTDTEIWKICGWELTIAKFDGRLGNEVKGYAKKYCLLGLSGGHFAVVLVLAKRCLSRARGTQASKTGVRRRRDRRASRSGERCHVPAQDRKSTRLNSSHVAISYAVFCLKKKKK